MSYERYENPTNKEKSLEVPPKIRVGSQIVGSAGLPDTIYVCLNPISFGCLNEKVLLIGHMFHFPIYALVKSNRLDIHIQSLDIFLPFFQLLGITLFCISHTMCGYIVNATPLTV